MKLQNELNISGWILDGNYNRTTFIKWKKVQAVIWLDYNFCRTFFQVINRAVNRSITKDELWENTGNRESFLRAFFHKESILLWVIKTHRRTRIRYNRVLLDEKYSGIKFIRLKTPAESEIFLNDLKKSFSISL